MTVEGEEIRTRDLSSGKVHRRILTPSGEALTFEGDNLDAAGAYEVLTDEQFELVEKGDLCERCFHEVPAE